ncbi:type II pantothenate kinase [Bacillus mycoides]|uniref:type II pantothenate kinase n=1 Tax=Bacillus mycoides TaxID=1405 RepID=UPI001A358640|nr:type II pantothenate kinase [Bacillus mycoides]MBJ7997973.1 type II pantothenate kinase [Bacillus cereus]MED1405204.1 type II pantothenate kinase [Bacillus mycoides]QWH85119.1 type II pantothenate kinase [Bacillus mycoides]QWI93112.1 type II pantothenate kinase [Bacillus mycoides]UNJ93473.1 type II pantothenate kinase [Bacillus mycoides]
MRNVVGIDAGGTLTKIAYFNEMNKLVFEKFYSYEQERIKEWLHNNNSITQLCITGGKATQLEQLLSSSYKIVELNEFEATLAGVRYILKEEKRAINSFVLTNIGTGTSIHYVHDKQYVRAGGTGVGGGTIMGLSKLLTNIDHFEDVIPLTKIGSRNSLDITVGDIYGGILSPLDNNLTASNFGKAIITDSNYSSSDILATVQGLVGEVVTALSLQFAEAKNIDHIIYIGSTLYNNVHLQNIINSYTEYQNKIPVFLQDGGYSGAIGALLHSSK